MATTKIEWATKVWNPITGCTPISPGCDNCYAKRMASRLQGRFGYDAQKPFQVTVHEDERWLEPLKWRKQQIIFVCSMGDLFHPDVPEHILDRIFAMISLLRQQKFVILTKRPERASDYFANYRESLLEAWGSELLDWGYIGIDDDVDAAVAKLHNLNSDPGEVLLPNLYLGVSAENQDTANKRIPMLLSIQAGHKVVSVEPMLGQIALTDLPLDKSFPSLGGYNSLTGVAFFMLNGRTEQNIHRPLEWVICGGETGHGARPMQEEWVIDLRKQCKEHNVPFFFKSWGKIQPGNLIDGETIQQFPKNILL